MDLKNTLTAIRTGWYLMLIGAVVAAMAVVALSRSATPMYEASATYVVSPGAGVAAEDVARGVDTLDSSRSRSIMSTLTEISSSDVVLIEAIANLGLAPESIDDYTVDSVIVPEANVMETIVVGPDPQIAASLALAIGDIGGAKFAALYQIYDVEVLDPASAPTEPSNPGLSQMLVIGVAIGLMAGAGAALLRAAWAGRPGRSMSRRLGAYDPKTTNVTAIEDHGRFTRAG